MQLCCFNQSRKSRCFPFSLLFAHHSSAFERTNLHEQSWPAHILNHAPPPRVCCFNHANQCSKQTSSRHCLFCSAYHLMTCVLFFSHHQYGSLTPSLSQIALYFFAQTTATTRINYQWVCCFHRLCLFLETLFSACPFLSLTPLHLPTLTLAYGHTRTYSQPHVLAIVCAHTRAQRQTTRMYSHPYTL